MAPHFLRQAVGRREGWAHVTIPSWKRRSTSSAAYPRRSVRIRRVCAAKRGGGASAAGASPSLRKATWRTPASALSSSRTTMSSAAGWANTAGRSLTAPAGTPRASSAVSRSSRRRSAMHSARRWVEEAPVSHALLVRREAGRRGDLAEPEHVAERGELPVRPDGEDDGMPIGRREEGAVRGDVRVVRAEPLRSAPRRQPVRRLIREGGDAALKERYGDGPAPPRPFSLQQADEHGLLHLMRREHVDEGDGHLHGRPVRRAVHEREPALGLDHGVVAAPARCQGSR